MAGVFATDRLQRRRLLKKERERAEAERKNFELKKAAELKIAYERLTEAHQNLQATQQQLVTQEKLVSLGQLTAGIAHEIKNPLNFVNNFAALSVDLAKELREEIDKRRAKSEGRGEKGEGRGEKGDGRGEKGDGRGEKGDGRGEKGDGRGVMTMISRISKRLLKRWCKTRRRSTTTASARMASSRA